MAQSLNPKAAPAAKKLMMALMGGAGLVLLGGGGVLVGLNSHLSGLQTTARQKQQEVDGSEGIAKRYLSTQDAYTQTQSRMQCLEASVSPKSYVPTLLGQLQALAATTHLDVQAVRPAAPAPPVPSAPSHSAAGGDVDTTGTYADTATFLYSLTRFPKIISVTGVQMHPSASTDKANPHAAPAVTTNLKLIAFMFHDDGADAPVVPGAALAQAVPSAGTSPTTQAVALPSAVMPPTAVGTISGAAGRAAAGAVGATKAANARGSIGVGTL